jgi:uncharacterized membrane protein
MQTSRKAYSIAIWLLITAALFAVVAIGAYVLIVGSGANYNIASEGGSWASFGSYLGGVLGPLFAFLAFVGVLMTVWLQAIHLDEFKKQALHQETQRVISVVSERIDSILAQPPNKKTEHQGIREAPITIFTIVSAAGTAALSTSESYNSESSRDQLIATAKIAIAGEASAIGIELNQLSWLLQQYENRGGSGIVVQYYKTRYSAVVCWLDAIGFLSAHPAVHEYFNPIKLRKIFSPRT